MGIKAHCTWGEGSDVMLIFKGKRFILYENPRMKGYVHGFVERGSTDLTIAEAELLAGQLMEAAKQARELDNELNEYMKSHKEG